MIDSRHSPHFHFQEDLNPPYLSTMSHAKIHERGDVWGRHGVAYSRLIIAYLDPAGWSVCELHQDHK